MNLAALLTIGITTRNRHSDLRTTLSTLKRLNLGEIPLILVDDASDAPISPELFDGFQDCRLFRSPNALGLVSQRNRIAAECKTTYLLTLDDDSCVRGVADVEAAIAVLENNQEVAVAALRVIEKTYNPVPLEPEDQGGYTHVRSYVGCGHIIRVSIFRQLDGYREDFHYHSEERDLAMRAYAAGYTIAYVPRSVVFHYRSPCGRSSRKLCFYRARNTILCYLLNIAPPINYIRALRCIPGLLFFAIREKGSLLSSVQGLFAGIVASTNSERRSRLSLSQSKKWLSTASLPGE